MRENEWKHLNVHVANGRTPHSATVTPRYLLKLLPRDEGHLVARIMTVPIDTGNRFAQLSTEPNRNLPLNLDPNSMLRA